MTNLQAKMAGQPSPQDPFGPVSADLAVLGATGEVVHKYGTSLAKSGGKALAHTAVGVGVLLNTVSAVQALDDDDPDTATYKAIDSAVDIALASSGGFLGGAVAFLFDLSGGSQSMEKGAAYGAVAQSAAGLTALCGVK